MKDDNESRPRDVGFCKPPKHAQFKKGQSGNPKGRPKGALNVATLLERTLREKVIITGNGRRKTVSKLQAAITQLTNKATSGDLKAFQLLTALLRSAKERGSQSADANSISDEMDKRVAFGILTRIEAISKEDPEDANEPIHE
jgi:hypothetical protein